MCSPCPPLRTSHFHRLRIASIIAVYVTARVKVRAAIIDYLINHCTFADVSLLFSQNAAAFIRVVEEWRVQRDRARHRGLLVQDHSQR